MSDAEFIEREIMRLDTIKYTKSNSDDLDIEKESKLNLTDLIY